MTNDLTPDELRAKLAVAGNQTEYRLFFAVLLRREAEIPADDFYLVGGSALEIYTSGKYTSGDIDVVTHLGKPLHGVLRRWGFENQGRIWHNDELKLVVDLVKPPYTGSAMRTTLFTTPFGVVRLAAAEDLLVKRLSSAVNWRQPGDFEHAKLLALEFGDKLDWDYIERFAAEHQVLDHARKLREIVRNGSKREGS